MNRARRNLALPTLSVLTAKDFLGIQEDPGNRGPAVEFFQRVTGISPGDPWCAAFVFGVAEIAAAMKNVRNPLLDVRLKGYVESYWEWASDRGLVVPAEDTGVGDLFLIYFGSKNRHAHIGFVDTPPDGGLFTTVEGNANDEGAREGVEVADLERAANDSIKFVRWSE